MKLLSAIIAIAILAAVAGAQTDTTFSYQGELKHNGGPASGPHDMSFSLWSQFSGGAQVGVTIVRNGVPVSDGLFTVELDFGANAFDGSGRWLQVVVNGVTLAPRTALTRSPYSIQTRGIFVSDNLNVGIGTNTPQARLDVLGEVAGHGVVRARNPNNPLASTYLGWGTDEFGQDLARIRVGGTGPGAGSGLDIARYENVSLMRLLANGNVGIGVTNPSSRLHVAGDGLFTGRLGIGATSPLFGQLTVRNSGSGAAFGIEAQWNSNTSPAIWATNTGTGGVFHAASNSEATLTSGGTVVVGDVAGLNIAMDNNEIMARNNGAAATLHLNAEGGAIKFGSSSVHPAYAYAKIREDATIASRSSNVTTVGMLNTGSFLVDIVGGVADTDIIIATDAGEFAAHTITAHPDNGRLQINCYHDTFGWERTDVNFVIYRP